MNRYRVPLGGGHDPAAGLTTEEERYARLAYNIHMPEVATTYTIYNSYNILTMHLYSI